jgi:exonuclease III
VKASWEVLALQELLRQIKPDVIFLSESHLDKAKAENLMRKVKFDKLLFHESNGRSGGLILMWKKKK